MPITETIAQADVEIKAEFSKLQSGLNKARRTTDKNTKAMQKSTKKVTKGFNDIGKSIGAAAVGLAAFRFGSRVTEEVIEFAKATADLSAITGATGDDLKFFQEEARAVGAATTKSATGYLKAIKLIASAKPELLQQGKLLAAVTREAVALSEASGLDLPEAADSLTTALNQFGAPAEDASRFINAMAAAAKFGSAEIPQMSKVLTIAGTVASTSGIQFEEFAATVTRLAAFKTQTNILATSLRNIFIALQAGADETNPQIVGLETALDNLADQGLDTSEMITKFGKDSLVVAQQLISVRGELGGLTKNLTGTKTAYEQAKTRTDGLAGATDKLNSSWSELLLTLGDEDGAIAGAINLMTFLLTATSNTFKAVRAIIKDAIEDHLNFVNESERLRNRIAKGTVDRGQQGGPKTQAEAFGPGSTITDFDPKTGKPRIGKKSEAQLELEEQLAKMQEEADAQDKAVKDAQDSLLVELLRSQKNFTQAIIEEGDQELAAFEELVKGKVTAEEELAEFRRNLAMRVAADIESIQSKELDKMDTMFHEFAVSASQELGDLALAGELSAKSIGRAFARLALNSLISNFLVTPFQSAITSLFTGGKAGGGNVQANKPVLVGERGPELIVPKGSATVINSANTRGALGSAGVTVVQNIAFTTDVKDTVRAEIINAAPLIANSAAEKVADQMNRSGRR